MIQKTKLRKVFNNAGLQITSEAVDLLDDHFRRQAINMARRVQEGNVKRLTATLIWVTIGNWNNR